MDYILVNEDRHLNHFGAVRNAETLEWIGMAPIYDSGSSLGYDKIVPLMKNDSEVICKPFKRHHAEQLKLVSSFDWIDLEELADIRELIISVLSDKKARDYTDERRVQTIAELAENRIHTIEDLVSSKTHIQIITAEDDVEKDIAQDYR